MGANEAVHQAFPPVLTGMLLLVFGVLLALDWVNLARGDPDTRLATTIAATIAWALIATGVVTWIA